jgi:hypothetical protein
MITAQHIVIPSGVRDLTIAGLITLTKSRDPVTLCEVLRIRSG